MPSDVVKRLRIVFENSGDQQKDIAKKVNADPSYISKLLSKDNIRPRGAFIQSVCGAYCINLRWIMSGEGEMYTDPLYSKNRELLAFSNVVMSDVDTAFRKRFILALSKLNDKEWKLLEKIVDKVKEEG